MADGNPSVRSRFAAENQALAQEWKRLSRAATFVAILTLPAVFVVLHVQHRWPLGWSIIVSLLSVAAFRGLIDLIAHRMVPRASLYGAGRELREEDAVSRRRVWYWKHKYKMLIGLAIVFGTPLAFIWVVWGTSPGALWTDLSNFVSDYPQIVVTLVILVIQLPMLFFANIFIIFGPMLFFSVRQMRGYEPGDADWGVKLEDVRGQAEPKQEVERVISLWQSSEEFRKAGGKPERGLLFLGQPGTGKTMLSKAIATSFNSPIITFPGSGFGAMFIGLDALIVQILLTKARRLARKWGGQCIVFIDEIDAVGMRRQALQGGRATPTVGSIHDVAFHGAWGALTSTEDIVRETPEWRDRLFAARAPQSPAVYPPGLLATHNRIANYIFPGGMGGGGMGQLALQQLLVQMDGMDEPPGFRKWLTKKFNTFLDALYVVPRQIGKLPLRLRPVRPRSEQVYFIGATNVPLTSLDPALLRPGRMGRHIYFRTPRKEDRADIFDLYLGRVSHSAELDSEEKRDELARITNGYSPAMIEQVCSMALTLAHSDARQEFEWRDVIEAITTVESGTAENAQYAPEQSRATAIHEAGHAIASHLYVSNADHTRLSIRRRGRSLGHYQFGQKEERVGGMTFRHEEIGDLVMTLGAMAAEHTFYGENSTGVGGDVQMVTSGVAYLVGGAAIGPEPIDLGGRVPESERAAREQALMDRFEKIGMQIINRLSGGPLAGDPVNTVMSDEFKARAAARIVGQAYLTARCCMEHNREGVAQVAEVLVERREMFGNEVTELLESIELEAPQIDLLDESIWPKVAA